MKSRSPKVRILNVWMNMPVPITNVPTVLNQAGINFDYVWIEETANTVRVGIRRLFPISSTGRYVQFSDARNPWENGLYDPFGFKISRDAPQQDFAEIVGQKESLDLAAEAMNDSRIAMNERVSKVLSACANRRESSKPQDWWDWWAEYCDVGAPQKNVVVVDERSLQPNAPSISQTTIVMPHSCLVAGTPVWTERGLKPIESILPGDRVLAKDVTTGDVSYKPVITTTVRAPTSVHKITVGGDTITANLGHHFWVSGDGWTKTRNLAPKMPLHTVTGMQRITSVEDEGRQEMVYNLVVADFHTYFVGNAMVLSHDVQTPVLTNVKVPGLSAN